jgi:hypothetical protein
MAKPLIFEFAGKQVAMEMVKVSRERLYGYKEVEARDDDQRRCEMATLADDGRTLVGRGGVGLGFLSADLTWRHKSQLKPVNITGEELKPFPSSFEAPIVLGQRASTDRYLEHNIRAVYHLVPTQEPSELRGELSAGTVFEFPFSYRGGLEPDTGFLLANAAGEIFLTLGKPTEIRFLGLKETSELAAEEGAEPLEEEDLLDFEMI